MDHFGQTSVLCKFTSTFNYDFFI